MECNLIGWAQAGNHERGVATMVFRRQERRITCLVATLASMLVIPSAFVASAAEPASSAKIDPAAASEATQSVLDPAPQPQRRAPRSARGTSQQRAVRPALLSNFAYGQHGVDVRRVAHQSASVTRGSTTPSISVHTQIDGPVDVGPGGGFDCGGGGSCCEYGNCGPCITDWLACVYSCSAGWHKNIAIDVGVHGYTGPWNQGGTGSFGFHEGINLGIPVSSCPNVAMQVGFEATHSNLSGGQSQGGLNGNTSTEEQRDQTFFTVGLFKRADCGLQGGLVWDYLDDNWFTEVHLSQVRGEVSWVNRCRQEMGFWFTTSDDDHIYRWSTYSSATVEPVDLYAFFYRSPLDGGGDMRLFAGWTETNDGLLGADASIPLSDAWALEAEFIYLIPEEGSGSSGSAEEAWNVAINFVWYPHCNARNTGCNPSRPLFRVADNQNFIFDGRKNEEYD